MGLVRYLLQAFLLDLSYWNYAPGILLDSFWDLQLNLQPNLLPNLQLNLQLDISAGNFWVESDLQLDSKIGPSRS